MWRTSWLSHELNKQSKFAILFSLLILIFVTAPCIPLISEILYLMHIISLVPILIDIRHVSKEKLTLKKGGKFSKTLRIIGDRQRMEIIFDLIKENSTFSLWNVCFYGLFGTCCLANQWEWVKYYWAPNINRSHSMVELVHQGSIL